MCARVQVCAIMYSRVNVCDCVPGRCVLSLWAHECVLSLWAHESVCHPNLTIGPYPSLIKKEQKTIEKKEKLHKWYPPPLNPNPVSYISPLPPSTPSPPSKILPLELFLINSLLNYNIPYSK